MLLFQQLFGLRILDQTNKIQMYKTIIRSVVIYGSETFTMTRQDTLLLKERLLEKYLEQSGTKNQRYMKYEICYNPRNQVKQIKMAGTSPEE